ncbi:MAG: hypothetical protein V4689_02915 [Verrucomicrobiota bacterium]
MSYDDDWPDMTWENRRLMIKKTIRPISLTELKQLGEKRFPIVTDPWCIRYYEFLATHPDAKFYHAEIPEHAEIIYCVDTGKGIWFLPGKGMGIIQSKGREILAEVVAAL